MLIFKEVNEQNKYIARELLAEYGRYLFDEAKLMDGRASFFNEMEKFPDDKYKSPDGAFFIVYQEAYAVGCVGLKRFDPDTVELKRMYIKEAFRGKGFAQPIIKFILNNARVLGYKEILLDTNVEMQAAVRAYVKAGFREITPYCENKNANPLFFAYDL